jgi:hypothetical protein
MGLHFVYAAGPCQRSLFRIRVPWDSWPYFTVSDLRLPFSSPPKLVILRLTISQSVSLCIEHPPGAHDQIFIAPRLLQSCFCGAPSLTRGWEHLPGFFFTCSVLVTAEIHYSRCFNNSLPRIFLRNGLLIFHLPLWELNSFHVFVVAEVCVPIVAVAQRWT